MPGPHPGELLYAGVDHHEKQGHEFPGALDILRELAVHVGDDLGSAARVRGALSQG
jgi:hypothetical protein